MFEPIRWFTPLYDALFCRGLPFDYRWRLLLFMPIGCLTCGIKWLPWIFSRRYSVIHIPLRRSPGNSVRAIVFKPQAGASSSTVTQRGLRPLHLDFHGGGFLGGNPEHDAAFCDPLSDETGAVVVSAAYRYAPRHTFPTAHHDAQDVANFLIQNAESLWGADPQVMTVSGSSAGASLALGVAQGLAGTDEDIKGSVTFFAPVDLRIPPTEKPKPDEAQDDPMAFLAPLFDSYPGPVRSKNMDSPLMNPVLADLKTLPAKMLFIIPKIDILYDEQMKMVERLKKEADVLNSIPTTSNTVDSPSELECGAPAQILSGLSDSNRPFGGKKYIISESVFPEGFHGWLEVPLYAAGARDRKIAYKSAFDFIRNVHRDQGCKVDVLNRER